MFQRIEKNYEDFLVQFHGYFRWTLETLFKKFRGRLADISVFAKKLRTKKNLGQSFFFIQKNTSGISFFKKTFYTPSDNATRHFFMRVH